MRMSNAASLSPALTGMIAWYKTESLALTDGQAVASWPDSSGNGNTISQGTGSKQPIFKTGIINGRRVVRFSATNDSCLLNGTPAGLGSTGVSIYAVVKAITWSTWGEVVVLNPANVELRLTSTSSVYGWLTNGASDLLVNTLEGAGPWAARILRAKFNNATDLAYLKVTGISEVNAAEIITLTYPQIALGARNQADTALNLDGDIGEVLIYTGEIGASDAATTAAYLLAKWGLAA